MQENQCIVRNEKDLLKADLSFFSNYSKDTYVGVLTNTHVGVMSKIYPSIVDGILRIYNFVEKEETDPTSPGGFLNRHIRNTFMHRLISIYLLPPTDPMSLTRQ